MICMICGLRDCTRHSGYSYPEELLKDLFGENNGYTTDLEGLKDVEVGEKTYNVYGRTMVRPVNGGLIRAAYHGEQYYVRFADPRLLNLHVTFHYANGRQIVQRAEASAAPLPFICAPNAKASVGIDLIGRFGARTEGRVYLISPERYVMGIRNLAFELCEVLIDYFSDEPNEGTSTRDEIKSIKDLLQQGNLSNDTAVALLAGYFPQASEENFAIPMAESIHILDKSERGLHIFLATAAGNLYPQAPLHRELKEMISFKLFGQFMWNVFKKSESEVLEKYQELLDLL